ncbi:triphosphoribosyl-dephospho-CoA synthase [Methanogenium cariaci]|jgi:triphosphoribosyl-dephospho-CoA synthase
MRRSECAQIAMMLEVCAYPKPGNVDRCHDYDDTWLEHFLASAILARPAFVTAETGAAGMGACIKEAVSLTAVHRGGNTHFGAYLLLFPLIMGDGIAGAQTVIAETTTDDALRFYEAFALTEVRMNKTDDLDVNDPESAQHIRDEGLTLRDIISYSAPGDMVCREWSNGFALSRRVADYLLSAPNGKQAIVRAFFSLLESEPDTFIIKKLGREAAEWTMARAQEVCRGIYAAEEFDEECLERGINPGSIADITIAGIYLALREGWDWESCRRA